jgi:hypothetical protein
MTAILSAETHVLQGIIDSHSTQNIELQLVQHGAAAGGSLSELMLRNSVLIGNDAGDDDSAVELAARLGRARWGGICSRVGTGLWLYIELARCCSTRSRFVAAVVVDGGSRSLASGGKAP